jgi:hypothetical protein
MEEFITEIIALPFCFAGKDAGDPFCSLISILKSTSSRLIVGFLLPKYPSNATNHEISALASAWWPNRSAPFFPDSFRGFCIFDQYFFRPGWFCKPGRSWSSWLNTRHKSIFLSKKIR